jgi:hypothetical protein
MHRSGAFAPRGCRGVSVTTPAEKAVMPGLVPGIHVLVSGTKDVDGRDKPGHDESANH